MNNAKDLQTKTPKTPSQTKFRWLRRCLRLLIGFFGFIFLIICFIRSPWGQNIIVTKAVNYVANKTKTKVAIDHLFLTFDGDLKLDGLYLEDKKGDTLLYSKTLEANIPLWKMIKGEAVGVDALHWTGVRANIMRKDSISGYNFQFLIDAFAPTDTIQPPDNPAPKALQLVLGNLNFNTIDFVFEDKVAGIESRFIIGKLKVKLETIDLENMVFDASEIELSNSNIKFIQKPVRIDTSTSTTLLPKFSVEHLEINKVTAYYESEINDIIANLDIQEFSTEIPQINLSKNAITLNTIQLKNSKLFLHTNTKNTPTAQITKKNQDKSNTDITTFKWPLFSVNISEIDLDNTDIIYRVGNDKPSTTGFNPNAISLQHLNLKAKAIFLKDNEMGLRVNQFSGAEISGIQIDNLVLDLTVTDAQMRLKDFSLKSNTSTISGFAALDYTSITQLINAPEHAKVDVNFPSFSVSLKDVFKWQPALKMNPYLKILSKKAFTGNISALGTMSAINVTRANLFWGNETSISASGTFQNITNTELPSFNIPKFSIATKRADALKFVNEQDIGIQLPETINLTGSLIGHPSNISAKAKLTTSQGIADVTANYKNGTTVSYDVTLTVDNYKINELLSNPLLGPLSLSLKSKGNGKTLKTLNANLDATISKLQLNGYTIKGLDLVGELKKGKGKIQSTYKDEFLNINSNVLVILDSIIPQASAEINIIGANLQALGVMQRDVKTGVTIFADFKGNSETYDLNTTLNDGVIVYDNTTYILGDLKAQAHVTKDTTSLSLNNKIIDIELQSNSNPQTFITALKRHVSSYFYGDNQLQILDTITNPVNLKLDCKISQSPLLNEVFLVNVKDLDTINLSLDFNEKARQFKANITAPHINYNGNELDSLAFSMQTDKENFNVNLGFNNISAGPLTIPKTSITGNQSNNELTLNFSGNHDGETLLNIDTKITSSKDQLALNISSESLLLNKYKWTIPSSNEIVLSNNSLEFTDFKISKDNQSIAVTNKAFNTSDPHLAIDFKNFKISEVFNYLNPSAKLATGKLNGNLVIEHPFENIGFIADLSIEDLTVLKTNLGILSLNGNSIANNNYAFNTSLKGGDINLDLIGDYTTTLTAAQLNLDLNINEFKMKALSTLSSGELKDTDGSFNGKFKITGTTSNPIYEGALHFNNAQFNPTKLNTKFTLPNETLKLNNNGFFMSNFTVLDSNTNAMVVSGNIGTDNFLNPTFNLDLKATNFQVLNATPENNEALYGKLTFNADAKLTGDLQIPKLDAELNIGADTDVTYIMPTTYADIEERNGVVVFVNRENPDAILSQTEKQTATITGFDISTRIKIDKNAAATIILDEDTGDNFRASGAGELLFNMAPNGRISLTGVYEITDGHYDLNLYNLVNRTFLIAPGSRVTWSGNPFDAKLDVRAIYNLETSASALMASQISGADPSVKNKFRQVLPFNVHLDIEGELLSPEISFGLDMPEEEQGANGGQVYARVQQITTQESELNRQVFSLLVLNRFYPDSGSDGSSGGFATIARDNLNDAVSEQLNAFSDKLLNKSGVELDFGLNSYTDYQSDSATERTQLDVAAQKKLFDDRLIVRVGSEVDIQGSNTNGESAPLIGNVSLEYIVSEDGRYRLKGFRKSEFENVIDGQTIISGIALIFTQEFNQFNELWSAIFKSQNDKEAKLNANQRATDVDNKDKE